MIQGSESDPSAHFVPPSFSISMNRKVIACSGGCQAILYVGSSYLFGPTDIVRSIQRSINPSPLQNEQVKGHATESFLGSPHSKEHLDQPLSCFLLQRLISCNCTMTLPPVIFTINGTNFPVSRKYYIHKVRSQPWGLVPKSQTYRNPWVPAGRRAPSAGLVTSLLHLRCC